MDSKQEKELKCWNQATADLMKLNRRTRKFANSIIPINAQVIQSDRPDFVINDGGTSYVIDHFLVDFCYDGPQNNQSQSSLTTRSIHNMYTKYHDDEIGTIKDCDMESAYEDINDETRRIIQISNSFEYGKFFEAFERIFVGHAGKIDGYKKNSFVKNSNIRSGFLIEFHCSTFNMCALLNNQVTEFKAKKSVFPITKDIISLFQSNPNLDFIILAQYDEGFMTDVKNVFIFDLHDLHKSLEVQNIKVYDSVFYKKIVLES